MKNSRSQTAADKNAGIKKVAVLGTLAALAYVAMLFIRIPVVSFLKYEPKDVVITIGGLIFGPLEAFIISLVVSLVEMVTVSDTGWIGAVMNLVSTCAFACVAAIIYKKMHTIKGAVISLVCAVISMTAVMMLWNYFLTPLYMGVPREAVAAMLPTVFLPFNLLKGGLNAAITMLLYKPIVIGLRRARIIAPSSSQTPSGKISVGVVIGGAALLVTCILLVLVLAGAI